MRYSLHLLNIEYTIIFDKPLFTLPQVQVEILRKAYDHFGEIYSIGLSDLQAGGGTTFSDVFVRIGIPGLRGLVEIRADRFSGTFRGMSYQTQIEEVKTGVQRLEEMLAEILPHLGRKTTSISATSWITCEGGADTVRDLLQRHQAANMCSEDFGATTVELFLRGQLRNDAEGWNTTFALEPSVPKEADLYFVCVIHYLESGRYSTFQDRTGHFERMHVGILQHFGLEARSE
jgi:hypothetical protein